MLKKIDYIWKIKNDYLSEYVKKNPDIISKSLIYSNGSYFGEIPKEVSEVWDKIDRKVFKDKHLKHN